MIDIPLAFIAGAVFAVAVAVGATVVAVVATVGAVIAPIIAGIASVVGGIVSAVGTVLGAVIQTVGGIVEAISAGVQGAVAGIKTAIVEPLGNVIAGLKTAVGNIIKVITEPLAPILNPIKDSLIAIKDLALEIDVWVKAELAPVAELIEVVNTVSAIMVVKQLIEGTGDITQIIGDVEGETGAATAQAIVMLYKDIVNTTVATTTMIHDQGLALATSIDNYDEHLREDNQIALAMLSDSLDEQVTQVANSLTGRITPIESDVTLLAFKMQDVPRFQDMLIKALS